jgi:hypothetical protein
MAQVQRKRTAWYWSHIVDWMLQHPNGRLEDCAQFIGRTPSSLSIIINSDLFKAYYAQRKEQFRQMHDFSLVEKMTKVASLGLDVIAEKIQTKRQAIPMSDLVAVTGDTLKRLGYGIEPKQPQTAIQINGGNTLVSLPGTVSASDLSEARMALRQHQELKAQELLPVANSTPVLEAEPVKVLEEENESAPSLRQD